MASKKNPARKPKRESAKGRKAAKPVMAWGIECADGTLLPETSGSRHAMHVRARFRRLRKYKVRRVEVRR